MSPDGRATATALARLLVELQADRAALAQRLDDAHEGARRLSITPTDPGALALSAVALHAWYTGLETLFERVARELDGAVPGGDRWHRALISQMTAEIPGVRPAVVDAALGAELAALLAFRHFFRHAYAVALDAGRLSTELARLERVVPKVSAQLDALAAFLRAALAVLTSPQAP